MLIWLSESVPISLENDFSLSQSSIFILTKPGSIVSLSFSVLSSSPINSFCPVEKFPSKKPNFFFVLSVLRGKAFCFQGDFLGLGVGTVLVLTVKNKQGEGLLFVGCPSRK